MNIKYIPWFWIFIKILMRGFGIIVCVVCLTVYVCSCVCVRAELFGKCQRNMQEIHPYVMCWVFFITKIRFILRYIFFWDFQEKHEIEANWIFMRECRSILLKTLCPISFNTNQKYYNNLITTHFCKSCDLLEIHCIHLAYF